MRVDVGASSMTKGSNESPVKVDLGARAEAKLEVKAEIPSSSVGRFVEAVTDVFRPFTEARGLRGDQIRLQRADIAIEIAKRTRQMLLIENSSVCPVPNKILVPLIETASTESVDDDFMLDRWANLLASASAEGNVEPRYVSLLGELSGRQAKIFQDVALNNAKPDAEIQYELLDATFYRNSVTFLRDANVWWSRRTEAWATRRGGTLRSEPQEHEMLFEFCREMMSSLNVPGCAFLGLMVTSSTGLYYINMGETDVAINPSSHPDSKWKAHSLDLEILASLGLLRLVQIDFENVFNDRIERDYYHITGLGLSFFRSCNRVPKSDADRSVAS
jgi:hypothetical protein